MTIHKIIVVLVKHEIGNVNRQVLVPDVNEVPPHQNPNHLVESLEWRARKSGKEKDHLVEITRHRDNSTSQKIRYVDARFDAINTGAGAPVTVDAFTKQTEPPFTRRVIRARVSSRFKLPTQLGVYEGKTDPMDHLDFVQKLDVTPRIFWWDNV